MNGSLSYESSTSVSYFVNGSSSGADNESSSNSDSGDEHALYSPDLRLSVPNLLLFIITLGVAIWRLLCHLLVPREEAEEITLAESEAKRRKTKNFEIPPPGVEERPERYMCCGRKFMFRPLYTRKVFHFSMVFFLLCRIAWAVVLVCGGDPLGLNYCLDRLAHCAWETTFLIVLLYIFYKVTTISVGKKRIFKVTLWVCSALVYTFIVASAIVMACQSGTVPISSVILTTMGSIDNSLFAPTVAIAVSYSIICAMAYVILGIYLSIFVIKLRKTHSIGQARLRTMLLLLTALLVCAFSFCITFAMFLVATYASPPNFTVYLFQIWVPEICPSSIILLILMRKRRRPPRPHRTSSLLDIASGLEGSAVSHTLPAMVEMLPIPPPPKKLPQMIRAISVSLGHNTFQNPLAVLYQFDGSHLQEISRTEVAYESTSSVAFISLLLIPLHLACAVLKIGFYNIKEEESNLQGKEISLVDVRLELLQHNKAPPQLGAVGDSTRFCLHCCGEFQVEARSLEKGSTIRAYHFCPEVVVVEELFESPIAFQLPQQILSYLMPARQRDLPVIEAFCQELSRGKLSTVGNDRSSVSNLVQSIEQIKQYEAMITQFGETVIQSRSHLESMKRAIDSYGKSGLIEFSFHPSRLKGDTLLQFVPLNLHTQRISIIPWQVAQHACEVDKQCATSSNKLDPLATYSTVTFGAPTAQHVTKSPHHIGVLQLSAMHDRLSAEILPPTTPDIVAKQHLTQLMSVRASLHERSDVTLCHAACALAESFLAEAQRHILEYNIDEFVAQVCTLGFLFQCESLLSTSGSEAVMLSDYAGVINILRKFAIKVNCLSPTSAYDTQGSLLFIKPSDDNSWTLTIQLPISSSVIPNSFTCKVRAVLFTQGINEQQTVANAIGDTELQEIINRDAVDYISLYVSDFLSWQKGRPLTSPSSPISLPVPNFPPSAPELGYPKPKSPSSKPGSTSTSPISPTTPTMTAATTTTTTTTSALGSSRRSDTRPDDLGGLMEELRELVTTSRREKNVRILTTAADVTRLLNGGRAVSCKSAKDRTSMSVTLEQARILYRLHRVLETDDSVLLAANLMRHSGVRRENAFKNILKDKYAFNALQRRLLPQDYRPPVGTRAGLKAPQS